MFTPSRFFKFSLVSIFFIAFYFVPENAQAQKKATASNPNVEVYTAPDFDSEVVELIQPGQKYLISNKPQGPFYKIKLKNGKIGYVPDTEVDIEGVGAFEPKPYLGDEDFDTTKNKKGKTKKQVKREPLPDEDEEPEDEIPTSYHGLSMQLINYHEDTMGGVQVGDLFAVGYKYLPLDGDFTTSFGYDVFAAFSAPKYYAEKTGRSAKGLALWSSLQVVNMSAITPRTTLRYGAGPFAKYTNFQTETAAQSYTLQDLTVGLNLEAGLIFHFPVISLDLGLRYFWDKESYGGLGLTLLF